VEVTFLFLAREQGTNSQGASRCSGGRDKGGIVAEVGGVMEAAAAVTETE
jgi:hypothetical protein